MQRTNVLSGCSLLVLLSFAVLSPLPGAPMGGDVVVVANPGVPVSDLSFAELRRVFLGERQFWTSNLRISLLMRPPTSRDREVLLKTVYEMSEAQFRQHWIGKIFRAEATGAPQMFYSDEEIFGALAAIPGSIAVIETTRIPYEPGTLERKERGLTTTKSCAQSKTKSITRSCHAAAEGDAQHIRFLNTQTNDMLPC